MYTIWGGGINNINHVHNVNDNNLFGLLTWSS